MNRRLAHYRKERRAARLLREQLLDTMGRVCKLCGRRRGPWHLDHPYGRSWRVRDHSRLDRMKKYLRDWEQGNLRVLCKKCNETDGAHRRWARQEGRVTLRAFRAATPVRWCWYCSRELRLPDYAVVVQDGHPHRVHIGCAEENRAEYLTTSGQRSNYVR